MADDNNAPADNTIHHRNLGGSSDIMDAAKKDDAQAADEQPDASNQNEGGLEKKD